MRRLILAFCLAPTLACAQTTPEKRAVFGSVIDDFYLTNPIARASAIMAECSVIAEGHAALTAAE